MLKSVAFSECDSQDRKGHNQESERREQNIFKKMEVYNSKDDQNTLEKEVEYLSDSVD